MNQDRDPKFMSAFWGFVFENFWTYLLLQSHIYRLTTSPEELIRLERSYCAFYWCLTLTQTGLNTSTSSCYYEKPFKGQLDGFEELPEPIIIYPYSRQLDMNSQSMLHWYCPGQTLLNVDWRIQGWCPRPCHFTQPLPCSPINGRKIRRQVPGSEQMAKEEAGLSSNTVHSPRSC